MRSPFVENIEVLDFQFQDFEIESFQEEEHHFQDFENEANIEDEHHLQDFEEESESYSNFPEPKLLEIEFSRLPMSGSYWPLISSDSNANVISYITNENKTIGNSSRRFLADRDSGKRYHAAIDLYAKYQDPVISCEDGQIIKFKHFYHGAWALLVRHNDIMINYGEVDKDSLNKLGLKVGDFVKAGQQIGIVGKMYKSSMLHFEIYKSSAVDTERYLKGESKPKNLLNPTKYLMHLKQNGVKAISNSITTNVSSSWNNAIRLNNFYKTNLGWDQNIYQINDFLLPFSGQANVSLDEASFAYAVSIWQQSIGFTGRDADGVIGPKTWKILSPLVSNNSSDHQKIVNNVSLKVDSKTVDKINNFDNIISEISKTNNITASIIKGIIAAESGGNHLSGQNTSGYKGLMQAEQTNDQLTPSISIETGTKKFIQFRDKSLIPWLQKIGVPILLNDDEFLRICLSCYNAGPVTAMKAVQYAHAAGNWRNWLQPDFYKRALVFSGGYAFYSTCKSGFNQSEYDKAKESRLKFKFKTSGWRTESDPPIWSTVKNLLHPITSCSIETKFNNSPRYFEKFIAYKNYFENKISEELYFEELAEFPATINESQFHQDFGNNYEIEENYLLNDEIQFFSNNYLENNEYEEIYQHEHIENHNLEDDENYFYEIEDEIKDINKTISENRRYATALGWDKHNSAINDLLLPYSGLNNVSLGEEALARALELWQKQQGFGKNADGILGPNTWKRMSTVLGISNSISTPPVLSKGPVGKNIFIDNKFYAQGILDSIRAGYVSVNTNVTYNPLNQLQAIVNGLPVLNLNPITDTIQILPILFHICDQAVKNNFKDIVIGSLIRNKKSDGTCTGHCAGRCIDINFKGGSFSKPQATQMVVNILNYMKVIPPYYTKNFGFGLPMQGTFFPNNGMTKFKSVSPNLLIDNQLKLLVPSLGIVFPDNDNHLHIQVKWI